MNMNKTGENQEEYDDEFTEIEIDTILIEQDLSIMVGKKDKIVHHHGLSQKVAEVEIEDIDLKSCYLGNVDYSTSAQQIVDYFQECGKVMRVTILRDKWTGQPKGYAFIEFEKAEDAENALSKNWTIFNGRLLNVERKRKNVPGMKGAKMFMRRSSCTGRNIRGRRDRKGYPGAPY